jgi:hypothetical protein
MITASNFERLILGEHRSISKEIALRNQVFLLTLPTIGIAGLCEVHLL